MNRRTPLAAAGFAIVAGLALTACTAGTPEPAPTVTVTATPAPATIIPTATPTSDSGGSGTITLPSDCDDLGSAATREAAVGDMTLQSDGTGFTRPAPAGATLGLGCDWIVGDTTGMLLLISTANPTDVDTALTALPEQGYTCTAADDFGAEYCVLPGQAPDDEEVVVARDDGWIYFSTANRNGRAFLSEIVEGVFG